MAYSVIVWLIDPGKHPQQDAQGALLEISESLQQNKPLRITSVLR